MRRTGRHLSLAAEGGRKKGEDGNGSEDRTMRNLKLRGVVLGVVHEHLADLWTKKLFSNGENY